MSRPTLRREYHASDLRTKLNVSSIPDDRTLHTVFAVLINDIDRRSDMHQSIKQEVLTALAQAWLHHLESTGDEVHVEQHRQGVDTEVTSPDNSRPASSIPERQNSERFNRTLRSNTEVDISKAQFNRDMARLDDLRRKYSHPGLNTAESNEVVELRSRYDLSFSEWWQEEYRVDNNTDNSNKKSHPPAT